MMKLSYVSAITYLSVSLAFLSVSMAAKAALLTDTKGTAAQTLYVAVYEFPPYYSSSAEHHLIGRVVDALNERQSDYNIQLREIRPTERYRAVAEDGCCDVMLFESPQWGWEEEADEPIVVGSELTHGSDLYVTIDGAPLEVMSQQPAVGGMRGYHYQFTGYERNHDVLEYEHNLYLADNPITLLNMLMRGRLDVIMMSKEYLLYLRKVNADLLAQVALNSAVDQDYVTHLLAPKRHQELLVWFESHLAQLAEEGVLQQIFEEFGLVSHLRYQPDAATLVN